MSNGEEVVNKEWLNKLESREKELDLALSRIVGVYYQKGNGGYAAYDKWSDDLRWAIDLGKVALKP